jgi:hypothetical protein
MVMVIIIIIKNNNNAEDGHSGNRTDINVARKITRILHEGGTGQDFTATHKHNTL